MGMKLTVRVFAGLSESFGGPAITVETEEDSITVERLKSLLIRQHPDKAALIEQSYVAKNQSYANESETLGESDEIALIPPVSGGQPSAAEADFGRDQAGLYTITHERLAVEDVVRKVIHPHHGASLAFVGTTREYTEGKRTVLLEYEAYVPMALKTMEQIGEEISARWPGTLCAISHRLGKVGIGEISVVIAVSAPHRAACYDASRYAIERLKQIVPIWKREIWEDGSEWKGHQTGPWNPMAPSRSGMREGDE